MAPADALRHLATLQTQSELLTCAAMPEMSIAELGRAITRLEDQQRQLVAKEVYERDLKELRIDTRDIRDSQRWMMRLLVTQFVGLVVALIVFLVGQGVG